MVDPKEVFKTAEVFRASSMVLSKLIAQGMPQYMFPMVICSAFSLELHLKCLILIQGGVAGKVHDLGKLFSKLTPDSQKTIRDCYEPKKPKDAMFAGVQNAPKTDFDSVLLAGAKAFEQFRYHFEGIVPSQSGWMAGSILDCVRERIVQLKPDWADLKYGFNGPLLPPGM